LGVEVAGYDFDQDPVGEAGADVVIGFNAGC